MNYFKVMLECKNLIVKFESSNEPQLLGCFCTRYLQDMDINDAVLSAKELVQAELKEQHIICSLEQITLESIEKVHEIPDDVASNGFTFFAE